MCKRENYDKKGFVAMQDEHGSPANERASWQLA